MHDSFDPLRNDRFDDEDKVKPEESAPAPEVPQGDVKPAKEEPAHRQVQRRALRDLVSVSVECTTEEAAIEDRHTRELEESAKKYEWGKSDVGRRYENLRGTVREKYQGRLKDLTTHHATESNNAAAADKKRARRSIRNTIRLPAM